MPIVNLEALFSQDTLPERSSPLRTMVIVPQSDGTSMLTYEDPPAPVKDTPRRERFTPKHVAALAEDMYDFMSNRHFVIATEAALANRYRLRHGLPEDYQPSMDEGREIVDYIDEYLAHEIASEHRLWRDPETMLVHADDAFVNMALAAAISASTEPLFEDELMAPTGVVVFERPRVLPELELMGLNTHNAREHGIRALAWNLHDEDLDGGPLYTYTAYADGWIEREKIAHATQKEGVSGVPGHTYAHLIITARHRNRPGQPPHSDIEANTLAMLRGLSAVAASPRTNTKTATVEHRVKKGSRTVAVRTREVRTLALRHSEHGRYELEAATGRRNRAHWVRGHWRNQWYPSLEANRRIWIDGFVRGEGADECRKNDLAPHPTTVHLGRGDRQPIAPAPDQQEQT